MHGALGAAAAEGDVRNMDVHGLVEALNEHQLLVFRDQSLDPLQLADFGSQFGELDIYPLAERLPPLHTVWSSSQAACPKPRCSSGP